MIGRVQAQYYSQILQIVRETPGISRAQLAESMNLDRSTITHLINSLLDQGVLMHGDSTPSGDRSGRRQIPLVVNPGYAVILGIEIQQDALVSVLTNLQGKMLSMQKEMVEVNGENLIDLVEQVLDYWITEAQTRELNLLAVGIGICGVVDHEEGAVIRSQPLKIFDTLPVLPALEKRYKIPIFLDNDTNCCSWGVLAFSPDRSIRNFLYVLVEMEGDDQYSTHYRRMGTGWALALKGSVYYGDQNTAGEFKSFLCRQRNEDQFAVDYNARLSMKSDLQARARFLRELARNIAFTANILNLSHVFLGGNLESMSSELSPLILEEANINWIYDWDVDLKLVYSKAENYPVAVGAAGLAVERLFEIPFLKVSSMVSITYEFSG